MDVINLAPYHGNNEMCMELKPVSLFSIKYSKLLLFFLQNFELENIHKNLCHFFIMYCLVDKKNFFIQSTSFKLWGVIQSWHLFFSLSLSPPPTLDSIVQFVNVKYTACFQRNIFFVCSYKCSKILNY